MTSRELIRWSELHERRARAGWWTSRYVLALVAGGAIAAWVAWRSAANGGPAELAALGSPSLWAGLVPASHAWVAATVVAFAIAFLRVPFHVYWRHDASLLAQLPIEGGPLFDAALLRCLHAAKATTLAALIGALPIAQYGGELYARHAALALALGVGAGLFIPAVATWAASLVAIGQSHARMASLGSAEARSAAEPRADVIEQMRAAAGVAQAPPSTALLGALPGFAGTIVIVGALALVGWLVGRTPIVPAPAILGGLVGIGVLSILAMRARAPKLMGTILRDVSALDRQRLAHLEIRPPTALERVIGSLTGDGALPYSKDARLVRRRYPMAFALGALSFLVLVIVGIAQPEDPGPWLTATIAGAAAYGVVLAGRMHKKPIELSRLSSTLPIADAARRRAKVAWVIGWWLIYVAAPGAFAVARQADLVTNAALLGGATIVVIGAAVIRR